jgi:hypothetical protein
MQISTVIIESRVEILQKDKDRIAIWSYNTASGHIFKECK